MMSSAFFGDMGFAFFARFSPIILMSCCCSLMKFGSRPGVAIISLLFRMILPYIVSIQRQQTPVKCHLLPCPHSAKLSKKEEGEKNHDL